MKGISVDENESLRAVKYLCNLIAFILQLKLLPNF